MILIVFTKVIPQPGDKAVNVFITVGDYTTPAQAKRELIKEQIHLRNIHASLSLSNKPALDTSIFPPITDVVFLQLKQSRTPQKVKYQLTEYKDDQQKKLFMEKINASATQKGAALPVDETRR